MSGCHTTTENVNSKQNERSALGLCRPREPTLRVPAHRGLAFERHCRCGRSLKVHNFSSPIRLFLKAGRAPKVEDLGSALGRFCSVALSLQAADDGGNRNRRFAMQTYDSAESWAFSFSSHIRTSERCDRCLRGRPILLQSVQPGPVA